MVRVGASALAELLGGRVERTRKLIYDVFVNVVANLTAGGIGVLAAVALNLLPSSPGLIIAALSVVVMGSGGLIFLYLLVRVMASSPANAHRRRRRVRSVGVVVIVVVAAVTGVSIVVNFTWPENVAAMSALVGVTVASLTLLWIAGEEAKAEVAAFEVLRDAERSGAT